MKKFVRTVTITPIGSQDKKKEKAAKIETRKGGKEPRG